MNCAIFAKDNDGNCVTGEQCGSLKCTGQTEHIPGPAVGEVEKPDYGVIEFGKFKGQAWTSLHSWYLEYLMSEECHTPQVNKDKAAACMRLKKIVKGQLELKDLKK